MQELVCFVEIYKFGRDIDTFEKSLLLLEI